MKWLAKLLVVITLLGFVACGFRLRGYLVIPPTWRHVGIVVKYVQLDVPGILKQQLQNHGIDVNDTPGVHDALIVLEQDVLTQRVTSVSASTTPRQYDLSYTLVFSLIGSDGAPVLTSAPVVVIRQLTVNNDRILGSDSEEALIITEMHREAVTKLLFRLSKL